MRGGHSDAQMGGEPMEILYIVYNCAEDPGEISQFFIIIARKSKVVLTYSKKMPNCNEK